MSEQQAAFAIIMVILLLFAILVRVVIGALTGEYA